MSVPRDMSIWAARRLREALEVTAAIAGGNEFTKIYDHFSYYHLMIKL